MVLYRQLESSRVWTCQRAKPSQAEVKFENYSYVRQNGGGRQTQSEPSGTANLLLARAGVVRYCWWSCVLFRNKGTWSTFCGFRKLQKSVRVFALVGPCLSAAEGTRDQGPPRPGPRCNTSVQPARASTCSRARVRHRRPRRPPAQPQSVPTPARQSLPSNTDRARIIKNARCYSDDLSCRCNK
jgi:hypothetical protein